MRAIDHQYRDSGSTSSGMDRLFGASTPTLVKAGMAAAMTAIAWMLFGLVSSAHFFFSEGASGGAIGYAEVASRLTLFYLAWALVTPLIFMASAELVRHPRDLRSWITVLTAGVGASAVQGIVYVWTAGIIGMDPGTRPDAETMRRFALHHGGGDAATFFGVVGLYLLVRLSQSALQRERDAAVLRARLAQADLEILRWQLHPHFLFNALNTVSTLVIKRDNASAERAIELISRYLRRALNHRGTDWATLEDELDVAQRYLEIERLRFGPTLSMTVSADSSALATAIPALILQPLVENAVRHGAPPLSGTAQAAIALTVECAGEHVRITIANRVSADHAVRTQEPTDAPGFGNVYVEERLRHHYGADASFRMERTGDTVVATVTIPAGGARRLYAADLGVATHGGAPT